MVQWTDLQQESVAYIETYKNARNEAAMASWVLPTEGSIRWHKPKRGRLRLDVDYSINNAEGVRGVGAILRNAKCDILFALAKPIARAATVLHGELQALVFRIKQCVEDNYSPVEVFSDSMLAVIAVAEDKEEVSVLYEDIFDFFSMVKDLYVISINHTRREANKAAHELAYFASYRESTLLWHDSWHSWLLSIVSDDSS